LVGRVSNLNWTSFRCSAPHKSACVPVHVHFPALLEQPPVGRVRKRGLVYPKLAQSKGSGDRMLSPDLFWGSQPVSGATFEPESKDTAPRRTASKPALPETGFFAFSRARNCFDWLTGGKSSSDYASSSSSSSQLLGFGFGPWYPRRCKAPVIEDGAPLAPSSRHGPVFLVSSRTPLSSYSSRTSVWSRGWGNSSVSVAFGVGA